MHNSDTIVHYGLFILGSANIFVYIHIIRNTSETQNGIRYYFFTINEHSVIV